MADRQAGAWDGTQWVNLKGEKGDQGDQGDEGPQGVIHEGDPLAPPPEWESLELLWDPNGEASGDTPLSENESDGRYLPKVDPVVDQGGLTFPALPPDATVDHLNVSVDPVFDDGDASFGVTINSLDDQSNEREVARFAYAPGSGPKAELGDTTTNGDLNVVGFASVFNDLTVGGDVSAANLAIVSDPSTGQLQINGIEMGDTGWRDISGNLINGWEVSASSGYAAATRNGNIVTVSVRLSSASQTNTVFWDPPSGFRPHTTYIPSGSVTFPTQSALVINTTLQSGQDVKIANTAGETTIVAAINYPTDDPWPTSLPGSPV